MPDERDDYARFYDALVPESATVHDFDKAIFFEGCLPIEVMAHRGEDTLRLVHEAGRLVDPRTGRAPYAAGSCGRTTRRRSLQPVGFRPSSWGEQEGCCLIPGLERADSSGWAWCIAHLVNGPPCSRKPGRSAAARRCSAPADVGVEGYVESAASGCGGSECRGARSRPSCRRRTAPDHRDWRAGLLRVARQPGALSAVEHHVRHHAAAGAAAEAQTGAQAGDRRARAGRSADVDA